MAVAQAEPQENSITSKALSWPQKVSDYFDDLKSETKKVTWPSRPQVLATTSVVIASVFAFAAYFWLVDLLIGRGITKLFDALTK
jgi:preprotein translocase subunit SecE